MTLILQYFLWIVLFDNTSAQTVPFTQLPDHLQLAVVKHLNRADVASYTLLSKNAFHTFAGFFKNIWSLIDNWNVYDLPKLELEPLFQYKAFDDDLKNPKATFESLERGEFYQDSNVLRVLVKEREFCSSNLSKQLWESFDEESVTTLLTGVCDLSSNLWPIELYGNNKDLVKLALLDEHVREFDPILSSAATGNNEFFKLSMRYEQEGNTDIAASLAYACHQGDLNLVKTIIFEPSLIPEVRLFEIILQKQHLDILKAVFNHPNVDKANVGSLILFKACQLNYFEAAEYLMLNFADLIDPVLVENEALKHSVHFGNEKLVALLLADERVVQNVNLGPDQFPINIACRYGYLNIIKMLMQNGADPSLVEPSDNTNALLNAVLGNNFEAVKLLLDYDFVDPCSLNYHAVVDSCSLSESNIFFHLFEKCKDGQDLFKEPSFLTAILAGNMEIVKFLILELKMDPCMNDSSGILLAVRQNRIDIYEFLVEHGKCNVDEYGNVSLIHACANNMEQLVPVILKDQRINHCINDGEAFRSAIQTNPEIFKFLVQLDKCNPDHYAVESLTHAARMNFVDVVKLLLPIVPNKEDIKEAFYVAAHQHNKEVLKSLIDLNYFDPFNKETIDELMKLELSTAIETILEYDKSDELIRDRDLLCDAVELKSRHLIFFLSRHPKVDPNKCWKELVENSEEDIVFLTNRKDFDVDNAMRVALSLQKEKLAFLLLPEVRDDTYQDMVKTALELNWQEFLVALVYHCHKQNRNMMNNVYLWIVENGDEDMLIYLMNMVLDPNANDHFILKFICEKNMVRSFNIALSLASVNIPYLANLAFEYKSDELIALAIASEYAKLDELRDLEQKLFSEKYLASTKALIERASASPEHLLSYSKYAIDADWEDALLLLLTHEFPQNFLLFSICQKGYVRSLRKILGRYPVIPRVGLMMRLAAQGDAEIIKAISELSPLAFAVDHHDQILKTAYSNGKRDVVAVILQNPYVFYRFSSRPMFYYVTSGGAYFAPQHVPVAQLSALRSLVYSQIKSEDALLLDNIMNHPQLFQ